MRKEKVMKLVKEMQNDVKNGLIKECIRLLNSGAVDYESYADNYELPKILLSVALKNMAYQYRPLSNEGREEAKNLSHF